MNRMKMGLAALGLAAAAGVSMAQPANNACANAVALSIGVPVNGTTINATRDGTGSCGSSSSSVDVWYKYTNGTAATQSMIFDTCAGANFDTVLVAFSGCGGSELICNDDSCGLQSSISVNVNAGATVLIRVAGYLGATGTFTITASQMMPPTNGPDVIVGDINGVDFYGNSGGVSSYALGTTSCNIGDAPLQWTASNPNHPVISQNILRIRNNRLEQIGQSWLKHGFSSLNQSLCNSCVQPPGGSTQLGVGCSDPYTAGLNGDQGNLGPRYQVNATTGVFPYPYSAPGGSGVFYRRIIVNNADLADPGNSIFLGETQYIANDDAQWNNGRNNSSYRRMTFATPDAPGFAAGTIRRKTAIEGWADFDPTVVLANAEYTDTTIPGRNIQGRFWVASKVVDNGNGTWTYNYAVHNQNADRDARAFAMAFSNVTVTNVGYRDVDSHSGDPTDNTAWVSSINAGGVSWSGPTQAQNANANRIRWGTTFSFWFTANTPPTTGATTITLFKSGSPTSLTANVRIPSNGEVPCEVDLNGDGFSDFNDYLEFLNLYNANDPRVDFNDDGLIDFNDYLEFLNLYNIGC